MTIYAGETARFALELAAEDGKPLSPLPGSVTVEVRSSDEETIHEAEAEMTLQVLASAMATSGTATTITKTGSDWLSEEWRDACVRITSGTGSGQERRIKSNTATVLTIDTRQVVESAPVGPFSPSPDGTSVFEVHRAGYRLNWDSPEDLLGVELLAVFRAVTLDGDEPYKAAEKMEFRVEGDSV